MYLNCVHWKSWVCRRLQKHLGVRLLVPASPSGHTGNPRQPGQQFQWFKLFWNLESVVSVSHSFSKQPWITLACVFHYQKLKTASLTCEFQNRITNQNYL